MAVINTPTVKKGNQLLSEIRVTVTQVLGREQTSHRTSLSLGSLGLRSSHQDQQTPHLKEEEGSMPTAPGPFHYHSFTLKSYVKQLLSTEHRARRWVHNSEPAKSTDCLPGAYSQCSRKELQFLFSHLQSHLAPESRKTGVHGEQKRYHTYIFNS